MIEKQNEELAPAAPLTATRGEFDPLGDLFVAQSEKPAHIGEVNLRALTPFQRALLVIDGTVTKFIEAYTLEPVEVIRLGQENRTLGENHPWLDVPAGTEVVVRQVVLRGKYSYTFHAYAVSLILADRLHPRVRRELEHHDGGLGRALINSHLETRREVLWYGKEDGRTLPTAVRHLVEGELISRTYRIISKGRPIMLINEKFPYGTDLLPSHH